MDHQAFFEQGISLNFDLKTAPTEVEIRNAIGRIYYFTYHEALSFVKENSFLSAIYDDLKDKVPSSHKRLFQTFVLYASTNQELIYGTISRHLTTLHTMRCTSDYDLKSVVSQNCYFSLLANLESLKLEIAQLNSNFFNINTSLKSENITQSKVAAGNIIVRRKPSLKIMD